MKKRVLALLLTLIMVMSLIPTTAMAAESKPDVKVAEYHITAEGANAITQYAREKANVSDWKILGTALKLSFTTKKTQEFTIGTWTNRFVGYVPRMNMTPYSTGKIAVLSVTIAAPQDIVGIKRKTVTIPAEDLCVKTYSNKVTGTFAEISIHNVVEDPAATEATCTEPAMTAGTKCSVCGQVLSAPVQTGTALGHDWNAWEIKTAPTENQTGEAVRTCKRNEQHTESKELPVLSETSYQYDVTKAPTCTEKGAATWTLRDGTKLTDIVVSVEVAALGHDMPDVWTEETPAGCVTAGKEYRECKREGCDYREERTIQANDHVWSENWQYNSDSHFHECGVCGEVKDRAAHQWKKVETLSDATQMTYRCDVCKATKSVPVEQPPVPEVNLYDYEALSRILGTNVVKFVCKNGVEGHEAVTEGLRKGAYGVKVIDEKTAYVDLWISFYPQVMTPGVHNYDDYYDDSSSNRTITLWKGDDGQWTVASPKLPVVVEGVCEVKPENYTVTFNNGTTEHATVEVAVGSSVADKMPENPVCDGYTFTGWNTEADGSGTAFVATTSVSADTTVWAQWTKNEPVIETATVTFNNGTNKFATVEVAVGSSVADKMPENPVCDGYTFTGWNTEADGSGTAFVATTSVSADTTVWAQWTKNEPVIETATVTFNNGTNKFATVEVAVGSSVADKMPENPVRDGYTFTGWNTEADGSGTAFVATTPVSADTTVWAQWTKNEPVIETATVTFNNGTTKHATVEVAVGSSVADKMPENPVCDGYTFTGWNTEADGSGTAFVATTSVSADTTVWAQWTKNEPVIETATVTFNNGTNKFATVEVAVGSSVADKMPENPVCDGYTFTGWNTEADGSGTAFVATTSVSADTTVWAQWTKNEPVIETATVTFNNGTNKFATVEVAVGSSVADKMPENPVRDGYTFTGWNTEADGSGTAFVATTSVSADTTVWAQWTKNEPVIETATVTFNNGTNKFATVEVAVGSSVADKMPENPVCDGYTFTGWNTEADGSGTAFVATTPVSADTTVWAQWTKNEPVIETATVTFNNGTTKHATVEVAVGSSVADRMPENPVRNGYTFAGWNTEANGSGTAFVATTPVSADTIVWAQWTEAPVDPEKETFRVDFDSKGGTPVGSKIVIDGEKVPEPADPTRTDYKFAGWYLNGAKYDFDTPVTGSLTLVAAWTYDGGSSSGGSGSSHSSNSGTSYTLKYVTNGGKLAKGVKTTESKSKPWEKDFWDLAFPVREGYRFNGWFLDESLKEKYRVEDDVDVDKKGTTTLYADWVKFEGFEDVPEDFWAYDAIMWAGENGYTNGESEDSFRIEDTFAPYGVVTREQMWMILARLSGETPADMAEAREWAMETEVSDGSNPTNFVTRQQMVAILYRYADLMGYDVSARADLTTFSDHVLLADYAVEPMGWSVANSIVGGTLAGTLDPFGNATRAQFITIIMRFCSTFEG